MGTRFEELDWQQTPIGEVSLRRRLDPAVGVDVYEVKLGDEFLMSSAFTVAEVELARLALAAVDGADLHVVVGGLGLGYTARAVLEDHRVRSMTVVDAVGAVVGWHRRGLLPFAGELTTDPRCTLVEGDFFAMLSDESPFGAGRYDAVVVDVDHSPRRLLHPSHASFYEAGGLRRVEALLRPRGVFALWSDDPPDDAFLAVLEEVFASSDAHVVTFPNPYTGGDSANTVYVATRDGK
jgi:spermidine synthase